MDTVLYVLAYNVCIQIQVQDYYLSLRFNNVAFSVQMLYRLYVASSMLRHMKIKGRGTAHNYPKMELTQLLILEYWRKVGYYAGDMMEANMSIANEELGEATFSLLGRAVLGDSCRSDFQYMRGVYKLLPIYREVKNDLSTQQGKKDTINWHHRIKEDDEAVLSTRVFFQRLIRGVKGNWYKSYNGQPDCYMSYERAQANLNLDYVELVYQPDHVRNTLRDVLDNIKRSLRTTFLSQHQDVWPIQDMSMSGSESDNKSDDADEKDMDGDQEWGAPWHECREGWYALSRSEFVVQGNYGIALYLIVSLDDDKQEDGEEYYSFQGRQLTCSIDNCNPSCIRDGVWKMHRPPGRVQTETVFDWEVIAYFPAMNENHRIPSEICAIVEKHGEKEILFRPT